MATGGPSWYDLLGLTPEATAAEIKAAWRDATDKFEPGSGGSQFRLFNEAADTLLDPEKRSAYDAQLGVTTTAPEVGAAPVEAPAQPEPAPVAEPEPAPAAEAEPAPIRPRSGLGSAFDRFASSTFALAIVAVLAVASLVAAGLIINSNQNRIDDANLGPEAMSVATTAIQAALTYDYRHINVDRDRAAAYVAPSFRREFLATYDLLTKGPNGAPGGAIKLQAVQTAVIENSGVVNVTGNQARILVFLNTSTTKGAAAPLSRAWRIQVTMVHLNGSWLVQSLDIY